MKFEKQLNFIKAVQKEYFSRFGMPLVVDFEATKGASTELLNVRPRTQISYHDMVLAFEDCVSKYGANRQRILDRSHRLQGPEYEREVLALVDFCAKVINSGWCVTSAGKIIGQNHSMVYYHAKKLRQLSHYIKD